MVLLIGGERDGQVAEDHMLASEEDYERVDVDSFRDLKVAVHLTILPTDGGGLAYARIVRWIAHCEDNDLLSSLFD